MNLRPLVRTSQASIEPAVMICQQREHRGLVSLKALDAMGREMDDQYVDHEYGAAVVLQLTRCAAQ